MKVFIVNIICCAIFEVLAGVLLPSGKLKKFTLSIVGFYLFCSIVAPLVSFIERSGTIDFNF